MFAHIRLLLADSRHRVVYVSSRLHHYYELKIFFLDHYIGEWYGDLFLCRRCFDRHSNLPAASHQKWRVVEVFWLQLSLKSTVFPSHLLQSDWACFKPVTCKMFKLNSFVWQWKHIHLVGRFSFSGLTYSVKHLASTGGLYHSLVEDLFKNILRQNENCMKWLICCYKAVCLLLKLSQHHNNCDCTSTDEPVC